MTAALAASRERERLEIQHQPIGIAERVVRGAQGHRNPIDASHSVGHLPRRARRHPYASSDRPRAVHPVLGFGAHRGDGQGRGSRQAVLRDREEPARRSRARGSEDGSAVITCDTASFSIKTLDAEDFPRISSRGRAAGGVHPFTQFASMVKRVARVVSKDESRAILTGVLITLEDTTLKMVATTRIASPSPRPSFPNPAPRSSRRSSRDRSCRRYLRCRARRTTSSWRWLRTRSSSRTMTPYSSTAAWKATSRTTASCCPIPTPRA